MLFLYRNLRKNRKNPRQRTVRERGGRVDTAPAQPQPSAQPANINVHYALHNQETRIMYIRPGGDTGPVPAGAALPAPVPAGGATAPHLPAAGASSAVALPEKKGLDPSLAYLPPGMYPAPLEMPPPYTMVDNRVGE